MSLRIKYKIRDLDQFKSNGLLIEEFEQFIESRLLKLINNCETKYNKVKLEDMIYICSSIWFDENFDYILENYGIKMLQIQ